MSRAWLGVFLAVALVGPLVLPAAAQGQQPFFTIDAKDAGTKTISKDLGAEQLEFNVSVNPSSATPLSERFSIQLDVTMEPAQFPNGFGASLSAPDLGSNACTSAERKCSVAIKPSEVVRFVVTVSNTATDPDAPGVGVTMKYVSTPSFEGQPDNPLTAQLVSQMSQTDSAEAKGSVNLKLDASEQVASFVKRYPFAILLVAGGIFVLGIVLVRRRKGGLMVATESPIQEVLPGRGASFPVQVVNEGGAKQALSLTTSDVPPGWSAILPVDRVELGPNEQTTIWLTLKAPQDAQPGEHIQVNFVATTSDGTSAESLVEAVVVERYGQRPQTPGQAPAPMAQPVSEPEAVAEQPPVARAVPRRRKN